MQYYQPQQQFAQPAPMQGMNTFPLQGQPQNTTQSGISYDQLRNDLATFIAQNQNNDALAMTLAQECANLPMGNWLSGKMDKLVNTLAMTIDFVWNSHHRQIDLNRVYGEAIAEVYNCAWAMTLTNHPQLQNDPSVQAKMPTIQHWQQFGANRYQQFVQAGLTQNLAPQRMNTWNTQAGQPMMNNQPTWGSTGQVPQTTYYNNPPASTPGYRPANTGYNQPRPQGAPGYTPYQAQQTAGLFRDDSKYEKPWNPAYPAAHQDWTRKRESLREDQDGRIARIMNGLKNVPADVPRDKYGFPIEGAQATPKYTKYGTTEQYEPRGDWLKPENAKDYDDPTEGDWMLKAAQIDAENQAEWEAAQMKQSPESMMPAQPGELYRAVQGRMPAPHEGYKPLQMQPTVSTPSQRGEVPQQATARLGEELRQAARANLQQNHEMLQEIEFSHGNLVNMFNELKEESNKPVDSSGLLADEVRYLTKDEVLKMYEQKVPFEAPYNVPMTARPMFFSLHAVLTKEGKVRQIITRLGEDMKRSVHDDILAPLRERISTKRDVNASKEFMSTFVKTSQGGVEYDRFAAAKVVLEEGLKVAETKEIGTPEFHQAVEEAFEQYDKQAAQDLDDDRTGISAFKASNHLDDDEDAENFLSGILPEETRQVRRELAANIIRPDDFEDLMQEGVEVLAVAGINDVATTVAARQIANKVPVESDRITVTPCRNTQIITRVNTPKRRAELEELLQPFFWNDAPVDKEKELEWDGAKFAERLRELHNNEAMPITLWERLNTIATDVVNNYLKYTCGVNISIDDFAYDYDDLEAVYGEQTTALENSSPAWAVLDAHVALAMRCLKYTDDIEAVYIDGLNVIHELTIEQNNNFLTAVYPTTATANGVEGDVVFVTEESDHGLFEVVKQLALDAMATRVSRKKYAVPMNAGAYLQFADGKTYRIYMRIGDQVPGEDLDHFCKMITLVRQPGWL